MNSLIAFFAKRRLFGNLITLFVVAVGLFTLSIVRRDAFPKVSFDIVTVNTLLPGASSEQIEKLITNPLERDLKEVDGIKKLRSISTEGRSYIVLQLDPDQTTEAKGKADVQDVVDRFEKPDGAEDPLVITIDSRQTPIIEVAVSGEVPELEMRELARRIEREIEKVSGVARVASSGLRDREIRIEARPDRLRQYRLSLDEVIQAVRAQNVSVPGGSVENSDRQRIVRTVGEFKTLDDVRNTVVRANDLGLPIRVKDLAIVSDALEKPTILSLPNGKTGLTLTVLKKEKSDAINVVDDVRAQVETLIPQLDKRLRVDYINDFSEFVKRRVSVLSGNLLIGLFLVLGLLAILLPAKVALLVSLGIPFSFLGAIIAMYNLGISVNLISLLGLIIVVGMLVDDAIVIMDNCLRKMEEGIDPEQAAIEGTKEVWAPVMASVLTTVLAFAPMMFMSGIFGRFVWQIPFVVIVALFVSLIEAYFILPGHIAGFIRVAKKGERSKNATNALSRMLAKSSEYWDSSVVPRYRNLLSWVLRRRYWVAVGMLVFFLGSLGVATQAMRFVLFPPDGVEVFFVRLDAPVGTSLKKMRERVRSVENKIGELPSNELSSFISKIGIQQAEPNDPNTRRGDHFAQVEVFLTPETSRTRTVQNIIDALRPVVGIPEGIERLSFERPNTGPPVGKPVSLSVRSDEYQNILPAVKQLKALLTSYPGVTDIQDTYDLGKKEWVVKVKSGEAAAAGLTVAQVGQTVRAAFDGIVSTTIQGLDEEVDVRVSYDEKSRSESQNLNNILVPNSRGALIPLSAIATITEDQNLATYSHEANEREVKVTAEVDVAKSSAIEVNAKLKALLPELAKQFPGVSVGFGGEDEDTQESMISLGRAFVVAILLIFLVLVFTFGKLLQPFLVLLTVPMGIVSVIWTLVLHGRPLSFMAMLGVIALAGVIVNNAIVMIDFVNQRRAQGAAKKDSILDAASMRLRPIFLTTASTVAGLLPTAYGLGGLDQFVVPIALALGWGLLFGSILTAMVFPAAIAILDDIESILGRWITLKES